MGNDTQNPGETAVWIETSGVGDRRRDELARALAAAGVDPLPGGRPASRPGLLLFDRPGEAVRERLRECARDHGRILAVHVGSGPLRTRDSWAIVAAGASDVVSWTRGEEVAGILRARLGRWSEIDRLVRSALVRDHLVGESPAWVAALRQVVELACFTDSPAMITGATGTGKELVARLIHTLDRRTDKGDLVTLDCTTIVPELSGSEFFGHRRGAFTSAVAAREGAFALADGGTLFLDEVGELPPGLQAELLRAVQEKTYKRVGGSRWRRTDFRLISATHRDLHQGIAEATFRRDFYYRIASWKIRLPALDERREDIPLLVRHFLGETFAEGEVPELDPAVLDFLLARDYPGNVRDLRQLVLLLGRRHVGEGPITVGDLPEDERPDPEELEADWRGPRFETAVRRALAAGAGLKEISNAAAEAAVEIAVQDEGGNLKRAARKLGVTDRALQMRRAARRKKD